MAYYDWSKELEIGEETVDSQHKWLVDTYNTLMSNYQTEHAVNGLVTSLTYLYEYTEKHFNYEEALQLKCGFPGYVKHKQLHDDFKQTALNLVSQLEKEGPSDGLAARLNAVIGAWLIRHIKMEDSKISAYFKR